MSDFQEAGRVYRKPALWGAGVALAVIATATPALAVSIRALGANVTSDGINNKSDILLHTRQGDLLIWRHGKTTPTRLHHTIALAMNDAGEILVTHLGDIDEPRIWNPSTGMRSISVQENQSVRSIANHAVLIVADHESGILRDGKVTWVRASDDPTVMTRAECLSNTGYVAGYLWPPVRDDRTKKFWAPLFLWRQGHITTLKKPEFGNWHVYAVNDRGDVVGEFRHPGGPSWWEAVLWRSGTPIKLNTLLPRNSGWTLETAVGINDKDEIVGSGKYHGVRTAYLLSMDSR